MDLRSTKITDAVYNEFNIEQEDYQKAYFEYQQLDHIIEIQKRKEFIKNLQRDLAKNIEIQQEQ